LPLSSPAIPYLAGFDPGVPWVESNPGFSYEQIGRKSRNLEFFGKTGKVCPVGNQSKKQESVAKGLSFFAD
jgi:hypothetical protein